LSRLEVQPEKKQRAKEVVFAEFDELRRCWTWRNDFWSLTTLWTLQLARAFRSRCQSHRGSQHHV